MRLLLILTLFVAAAFRLPALDRVPPGLYCDEASTGVDAWMLLETGRDQYGEPLPLFARSFGDFNEATYRYLVIPCIAALGRTEAAVRLPAALVGILSVGLLFLVACQLGASRREALLATFLLAASPWHVQFSRVGDRAVLLPAATLAGLYFFLRARRRPSMLLASGAAFAIALHTYSPARAFVPLFVLGALLVWARDLRPNRAAAAGAAVFVVVAALLLLRWLSPEGMARASYEFRFGPWEVLRNYVGYFDPRFLFLEGDPLLRQNPKGVALLHGFEILAAPWGLWRVVRGGGPRAMFTGWWLLLVPVPAALTAEPHATRAIMGAPLFAMLSAAGLAGLLALASARRARLVATAAVVVVLAASAIYYAHVYFVRYPIDSYTEWQTGMGEAFRFAAASDAEQIFVSDLVFLPHIFVLFYGDVEPETYQARPIRDLRQGDWQYTDVAIGRWRISALETMPPRGRNLLILLPRQSQFAINRFGCELRHVVRAPDGAALLGVLETPP